MPDMEDVVSDELRLRIERVLAYPLCPHHGEGSSAEVTPSSGRGEARCPAGGLLQEYLDQLGPEEDDDELVFQGSDSEASDLLYDQEKEIYTTPYLLYLQQPRAKRAEQPGGAISLLKDEVEERRTLGREREGAVGRTGHRSNSRESPAEGQEPSTSPSNSGDPAVSSSNSGDPPTSTSNSGGPANSASEPPERPERHQEASSSPERLATGDPPDEEEPEDPVPLLQEENDRHLTEEEEEDDAVQKTKKTKKRRRMRRRKKRRSPQREQVEEEEEGETEEDIQRANLEDLKKSIVLSLFRDFAKNIFAREHPDFQLFEDFQETDRAKETTAAKKACEP